jgi:signal transduction histidine kinase
MDGRRRWGRHAPWLALAGSVLIVAAFVIEQAGLFGVPKGSEDGPFFMGALVLAMIAWGGAGALIGRRRPENLIGLVLAGEAFLLGVTAFSETYSRSDLPFVEVAGEIFSDFVLVPLLLAVPLLLLLFPTGRPPSRRWNWVGAMLAVSAVAGTLGFITRGPESQPTPALSGLLLTISGFAGLGGTALAVASMVVRFRRSRGEERAQMRWLVSLALFGVLVFALLFASDAILGEESVVGDVLGGVLLLLLAVGLPGSIGVAILRYRLYELDVVVKKTFVALVLTLAFGLPVLLVLAISSQLLIDAEPNPVVLLVGGVALGILVVPIVRLARRIAHRITFGRRASEYEVLTAFGERVGETYSVVDVLPRMVQVLANATGATSARALLRLGDELREEASIGEPTGEEHRVPVLFEGEDLGALTATFPPSDPIDASKRQLMENLAAQAGLVLRNVKLIEELRASRQRLVAAQDEERRKIERNIHDGAQQQLVALTVKLRLAQGLIAKDAGQAETMLGDLQGETQAALDDLRDLARGIYPPLLADKGLATAIEAQARKSAMPTSVETSGVGRYPQEVESTVYFCTLEALNNVAKYADASTTTVTLVQQNGQLVFSVTDDGRGFDPASTGHGTGLQGMTDRLDAIGGNLQVTSAPGQGTTITGTVPAAAPGSR